MHEADIAVGDSGLYSRWLSLGTIDTMHVNSAMSNFVVQEICGQMNPAAADKIWEESQGFPAMRMVNGRFPPGVEARIGIRVFGGELTQVSLWRHASNVRVLHEDGSVAEW
jgi:galactonate dehydratase